MVGPVGRSLDCVRGLQHFDLLGEFRNAWQQFGIRLRGRCGKASLEPVAQRGQFGQNGVVEEGLAEACLVVAKLGLCDGEVLPDAVAFGAAGAGQAFHRV